tara:strand:+ start:528 stop:797 length:270 start_codon:yes stop_codon:yes gene_type:complete
MILLIMFDVDVDVDITATIVVTCTIISRVQNMNIICKAMILLLKVTLLEYFSYAIKMLLQQYDVVNVNLVFIIYYFPPENFSREQWSCT